MLLIGRVMGSLCNYGLKRQVRRNFFRTSVTQSGQKPRPSCATAQRQTHSVIHFEQFGDFSLEDAAYSVLRKVNLSGVDPELRFDFFRTPTFKHVA